MRQHLWELVGLGTGRSASHFREVCDLFHAAWWWTTLQCTLFAVEHYTKHLTFMRPFRTAGPLGLAKQALLADMEPFFVLNSDVICDYPFKKMLNFHKTHSKEGTIVVW